jgi:polyvinyl alcohol dehydrogenase (cytochrome)
MRSALILILTLLVAPARAAVGNDGEGAVLYREHCAACHDQGVGRAPNTVALRQMSAADIRGSLTTGSMRSQGETLSSTQLDALSRFLASTTPSPEVIGASDCKEADNAAGSSSDPLDRPQWIGWGAGPEQHRFQPASMARLAAADVPRLKLKWSFGFAGATRAYGQPAIVAGRLFVGSAAGKVYSLDARSGCTHWVFDADGPVRTAISAGKDVRGLSIYFGDQRANAYGVDALTGKLLWRTHVDDHPAAIITGAPILLGAIVYVPVSSREEVIGADPRYPCCTFRGSVVALEAASGKLLWKAYTIPGAAKPLSKNPLGTELLGPSGVAIWSSPTIDMKRRMIYVTTGDSYSDPPADTSDAFLAFRLDDGKLAWSRQMTAGDAFTIACNAGYPKGGNCPSAKGPDLDFASSAILVNLPSGGRALIAGQKSGIVHAIDPDRRGALLWQRRVAQGTVLGGVEWGSAVDKENIYVAVSDAQTRIVASGAPGSQATEMGASFELDPQAGGGIYAIKLETGEVAWHTPHPGCADEPGCSPAQSAAVTAIPGVIFSGGLDGHLRAYSATSGKILWDVDTKGEYQTANGLVAHGGSIDGPGAVVVDGMVYVNSGYAYFGSIPGNVLLTFSVDGK